MDVECDKCGCVWSGYGYRRRVMSGGVECVCVGVKCYVGECGRRVG